MKKRISDMMDCIQNTDYQLNQETPLSSQRIKELTMNKITNERKPRRTLYRILVAAAVITALTATVFATGYAAGWFDEFLERSIFVPESWSDASEMEDYTIELLTEPVSGIPAYGFDVEGVIDITVVSARLRPGSLLLFYHATNPDDYELLRDYFPGGVRVVMLDGTETVLLLSSAGRISDDPDSLYCAEYAADVPPVDEIDYIELADGTKIAVP